MWQGFLTNIVTREGESLHVNAWLRLSRQSQRPGIYFTRDRRREAAKVRIWYIDRPGRGGGLVVTVRMGPVNVTRAEKAQGAHTPQPDPA